MHGFSVETREQASKTLQRRRRRQSIAYPSLRMVLDWPWPLAAVTASGRPVLEEDETELASAQVSLRVGRSGAQDAALTLTSHRLLVSPSRAVWNAAPLGECRVRAERGNFFKSLLGSPPLTLVADGDVQLAVRAKRAADAVERQLGLALQRKAWTVTRAETERSKRETRGAFSTTSAGVQGLMRSRDADAVQSKDAVRAATTDLRALMDQAGQLVALSRRLQPPRDGTAADQGRMDGLLVSAGIGSPVTREMHGDAYQEELARQLADFLQPLLAARQDHMLAVVDAYCLFNRARGTEFISPDDMHHACTMLARLELGMRLRKFPSGVLVVQSDAHSEDKTVSRIVDVVSARDDGASELDVARACGLSLIVSRQYLFQAETEARLCRDDSPEGLRFYRNFFLDWAEGDDDAADGA